MKQRLSILLVLLLGVFFCANNIVWAEGIPSEEYFPLRKGSYWVYKGEVVWASNEDGGVSRRSVTWKMEVIDVVSRGDVEVAILKGHPQDLTWYQEGDIPGNYLIVQRAKKYYLVTEDRIDNILSRVKNEHDALDDLVFEDELFLDVPLEISKVFGPEEQLRRSDLAYVWYVSNKAKVDLEYLDFLNIPTETMQYRLIFNTIPDDTSVDFVPGVGIVRYKYFHHGAIAEADFKLVEYFSG